MLHGGNFANGLLRRALFPCSFGWLRSPSGTALRRRAPAGVAVLTRCPAGILLVLPLAGLRGSCPGVSGFLGQDPVVCTGESRGLTSPIRQPVAAATEKALFFRRPRLDCATALCRCGWAFACVCGTVVAQVSTWQQLAVIYAQHPI